MPVNSESTWRLITLGAKRGDDYCDHLMRLDDEDRRFRFFGDMPEHMIALHAGAAVADGRFIVACEAEGKIRGVGQLLRDQDDPTVGELAFSVEREWRRRGIGAALMQATIEEGQRQGLKRLELEILPDNLSMQHLARRFTSDLRPAKGVVVATMTLTPKSRAPLRAGCFPYRFEQKPSATSWADAAALMFVRIAAFIFVRRRARRPH